MKRNFIAVLVLVSIAIAGSKFFVTNSLQCNAKGYTFFLVDYGYHASIVLPTAKGVWQEFTFGEWQWFAKQENSWTRLYDTLILPTQSTLAKKEYASKEIFLRFLNRYGLDYYSLTSSPERLSELQVKINTQYFENIHTEYFNQNYGINFVKLGTEQYHLLNNCNHKVSSWLNQLDVEVSGSSIFSVWKPKGNCNDLENI